MKTLCLLILVIQSFTAFASGDFRQSGTRASSMAKSSVALYDIWSTFNNQAGLAYVPTFAAAIYYENQFLVKELGYKAAAIALPVKAGAFGIALSNFGFEKYNESKIGLAYGRKITDYFSAGVQLNYCMLNQQEVYPNVRFLTFEAGILAQVSKQLTIGVHVYNPFYAKTSKFAGEYTESTFRLGAAYQCTKELIVTIEGDKISNSKPHLKTGIEYSIKNRIQLRGGVSTDPSFFTFGCGLNYSKLQLDIGFAWHQVLGFSPSTSVIYAF